MSTEFVIEGFPMPPSTNTLHTVARGRIIKAKTYREYEKKVTAWLVENQDVIKGVRGFVKDLAPNVIHIDASFAMSKKDIIGVDGKPRRNDTSNRLKALHDVLSNIIIGIDDSYFWSGSFTKIAVASRSEACVNIRLKLRDI